MYKLHFTNYKEIPIIKKFSAKLKYHSKYMYPAGLLGPGLPTKSFDFIGWKSRVHRGRLRRKGSALQRRGSNWGWGTGPRKRNWKNEVICCHLKEKKYCGHFPKKKNHRYLLNHLSGLLFWQNYCNFGPAHDINRMLIY